MKKHEIDVMSKKEERLVDILHQSGFYRSTAKTLVYMLVKKTGRSKDIERGTDLQQPEVSVAVKELLKLGIISKRLTHKKGKGRPQNLYVLKKSVSDVRDFLIKGMQERVEKTERNIESLRTLISEKEMNNE